MNAACDALELAIEARRKRIIKAIICGFAVVFGLLIWLF